MDNANKERVTGAAHWIVAALFIVLTALPLVAMAFRTDTDESASEKRKLAPLPTLEPRLESLEAFPPAFEAYFNDHFGFRQILVRTFNYAMVVWFHTAPDQGEWRTGAATDGEVVPGREGWLFYAGDLVINDYRSVKPFTDAELATWQQVLETRRDWLAERGIPYLFTIAPNKHTIYPQYLPKRIARVNATSRHDQLVAWMAEHSDFPILDLRQKLQRAAQQRQVYNSTGTHWNQLGAFIAYEQMLKTLAPRWPELTPSTLDDYTEKKQRYSGGLSRLLGLRDIVSEDSFRLKSRTKRKASRNDAAILPSVKPRGASRIPYAMEGNAEGPRAVVFHDSFMNALKPFLSEHFSRVVYYWQRDFDLAVIEHEKPDIVIQEMVERKLMRRPPKLGDRLEEFVQGRE